MREDCFVPFEVSQSRVAKAKVRFGWVGLSTNLFYHFTSN